MKLQPGQNVTLEGDRLEVSILNLTADHVVHAFAIGPGGRATSGNDVAFYGRPGFAGVSLKGLGGPAARLLVTPSRIEPASERILLCLSSWMGLLSAPGEDALQIKDEGQAYSADIPFTGDYEKSLLLGEIYRRHGGVRFRVLMQGYKDGLEALNRTYGLKLETRRPVSLASV